MGKHPKTSGFTVLAPEINSSRGRRATLCSLLGRQDDTRLLWMELRAPETMAPARTTMPSARLGVLSTAVHHQCQRARRSWQHYREHRHPDGKTSQQQIHLELKTRLANLREETVQLTLTTPAWFCLRGFWTLEAHNAVPNQKSQEGGTG